MFGRFAAHISKCKRALDLYGLAIFKTRANAKRMLSIQIKQARLTDDLMKKAWREGYALGYERACDNATDWKDRAEALIQAGFSKTSYRKEAEEEEEWNASDTKAVMARVRGKEDEGEKDKIENIILCYCEGIEHLEFSKCEMPDMIREIKEAILNELEDAEHLDDARNCVRDHL